MRADDLHTQRQALGPPVGRHREARNAKQGHDIEAEVLVEHGVGHVGGGITQQSTGAADAASPAMTVMMHVRALDFIAPPPEFLAVRSGSAWRRHQCAFWLPVSRTWRDAHCQSTAVSANASL
jgi:hypothetical protein